MATNDLIPFHLPGDSITCVADDAVTGKRLVMLAGAAAADGKIKVTPATAGSRTFGVAARDRAEGADVLVYRPAGGIYPVTAGAAITANTALASGAGGKVVPAGDGDVVVAWALDDAAEDADAMVELLPATGGDVTGLLGAITPLTDNTGGTANNTLAAIPDPADTPASADALRDDLVANVLPRIRDAFADVAAKVNAIIGAAD